MRGNYYKGLCHLEDADFRCEECDAETATADFCPFCDSGAALLEAKELLENGKSPIGESGPNS